jgi:Tfp pilus assembly protein PilV
MTCQRCAIAMMSRMPTAAAPPVPRRPRAGLTIVEVLAALVLVSVGLLGMAGTAALSLRSAGAARRERDALRRLDLRMAALAAGGCVRATSGAAADPGASMREQWTVAGAARGSALVDARVEWREGARVRAILHRSAILC